MSIFFVALMITMTVCLVWKSLGKERAFWAAIGIVAASVVLAIAVTLTDFDNWLVLENHYSWIGGQWQVDEADVRIEKSVLSDLYLSFEYENETSATLSMKVIPMMNFLWGGLGLLVAGLAIRTSAWTQELKPFERPKKGRRGTPKK